MGKEESSIGLKKIATIAVMLLTIVTYYIITDPDVDIMSDLPFGIGLIIILEVVIKTFIGIVIIEVIPDIFTDELVNNREALSEKARQTPEGAGLILKALSIRLIAYATIFASAMISSSF